MPRHKNILGEYDLAIRAIDSSKNWNKSLGASPLDIYLSEDNKENYRFELVHHINYFRDPVNIPEYTERFLKIKTKLEGIVPFKYNRAQKVFFVEHIFPKHLALEPIRIYILKARQLGFSTLIEALMFHSTSLFCDTNSIVVAHEQDKSAKIFEMTKLFFKGLPRNFRPTRKISNKFELRYANPDEGGELGLESVFDIDTARNAHLGASSTYRNVHLSELARFSSVNQNPEGTLATLYQTIPMVWPTMIVKETTGYGQGFGMREWENKDDGYVKVFVSWLADETYTEYEPLDFSKISYEEDSKFGNENYTREMVISQLKVWYPEYRNNDEWLARESLKRLAWRRLKIKKDLFGKIELFHQEYPTTPEEAFQSTGNPIFNVYVLNNYKKALQNKEYKTFSYVPSGNKDVIGKFKADSEGQLKIFAYPKRNRGYVIGADIGAGTRNSDPSVAQILDYFGHQVGIFSDRIQPDEFAYILKTLALLFNRAKINPEANAMGIGTINKLTKDLKYTNVYMRESLDTISKKIYMEYGFYTSSKTRPIIINTLREKINNNELIINDIETVDEMLSFILNSSGKMEAESGKHDDRVMALALADHILPSDPEEYMRQKAVEIYGSLAYYEKAMKQSSNSLERLMGF